MKIPPDAIPDSTVITFVYEKAGQEVEFTSDNFPDDFDESVYHFKKRYDKVIRKGNAEPAIKDFVLTSLSGNDTTMPLLNNPAYSALLFIKDDPGKDKWVDHFEALHPLLQKNGINTFVISNNIEETIHYFKHTPGLTFLKCDVVPIKTAARTNPTLYILKSGTIINKWSPADWDNAGNNIQTLLN